MLKWSRLYVLLLVPILALIPSSTFAQSGDEIQFASSGVATPVSLWMPSGVPPYTARIDTMPRHGTLEPASDTVLTYTAAPDYTGPDTFTYTLTDSRGASRTATVALTVFEPPAVTTAATIAPPVQRTPQAVPNQYILHYRPGTSSAEIRTLVAAAGGRLIEDMPQLNAVLIEMASSTGAAESLSTAFSITGLEPNMLRTSQTTTPNDLGPLQWGLNAIHAPDAWDVSLGTGVTIGVLDTGVDRDHPDLVDHLLAGYDFVSRDRNPQDSDGHGTHVTGIANAATNNGIGVAGVAWDARTLPVRITGPGGATSQNIAKGIVYATDQGAKVINMSLGGTGWIKIEQDAVNYAVAHGVIVIAASGNNGMNLNFYPASYDHVISVGSTGPDNSIAYYSNYGLYVDIAAPGGANITPSSNIYSTLNGGGYGYEAGTSMATPHVAGVASLVLAAGHATTPQDVTEALLCSAMDLGNSGYDMYYGWGLVQAQAAVNYTPGTNACVPTVPHDDFDTPRTFSLVSESDTYTDAVDTTYATGWIDDPVPCAGEDTRTVWYRYDPVFGGILTVDTVGSTYDTVLGIYKGSRGGLTQRACNNDFTGTASEVQVSTHPGEPVYIMVSSLKHEGYEGTLTLNARVAPYPPAGCVIADSGGVLCSVE